MSIVEGGDVYEVATLPVAGGASRLLPGELPETLYDDDADHWIRVYRDLAKFHADLIDHARRRHAGAGGSADGTPQPDQILLEAHRDWLLARLRFWEQRATELATGTGLQTALEG